MKEAKFHCICVLKEFINIIEKTDKIDRIDNFQFNTFSETEETPTRDWMELKFNGWINVNFNIRFHVKMGEHERN